VSGRGAKTTRKISWKAKEGKKKKKKKPLRSFQSGELLLCALYYGGRNSRHKSCCRPRQKTCLNYKVTRKNNQKRWPLLALSQSLSRLLGSFESVLHTVVLRCAPLPLFLVKKKMVTKKNEKKKKTISNWFSP
jgi:hypothetical protein